MKVFPIIGALLLSAISAHGIDAKEALSAYGELSKKSENINKASSQDEVLKILGMPKSKEAAYWSNPEAEVWHYLSFTDESQHLSFSVRFSPESGCSVSATHKLRKDIEKEQLRAVSGVIRNVYPYNQSGRPEGFLCHVQFDGGGLHTLTFEKSDRVMGKPEKGARIIIKHYGSEFNYVYQGSNSLHLKSIAFTKNGEQDGAE